MCKVNKEWDVVLFYKTENEQGCDKSPLPHLLRKGVRVVGRWLAFFWHLVDDTCVGCINHNSALQERKSGLRSMSNLTLWDEYYYCFYWYLLYRGHRHHQQIIYEQQSTISIGCAHTVILLGFLYCMLHYGRERSVINMLFLFLAVLTLVYCSH